MICLGNEQWLSTSEVTDTLNISRSTLFSLRKSGDAPKNVKLGRSLYYNQDELLRWLHRNEQAS